MKNNTKPIVSHIKTFDSICYYKNKSNNITKLDKRAIKGVLVGFNYPIYKVFSLETKKCLWVRDIHIIESSFIKSNEDITFDNKYMEVSLTTPVRVTTLVVNSGSVPSLKLPSLSSYRHPDCFRLISYYG